MSVQTMTDEELLAYQREKMKEIRAGQVLISELPEPLENELLLVRFTREDDGRARCVAACQTANGPKLIGAEYEAGHEAARRAALRAVTRMWAELAVGLP